MNALMLKTHKHCPGWAILRNGQILRFKGRMRLNNLFDSVIDGLAIGVNFLEAGPLHLIFGHVIPGHFIYARLKNLFKIVIDGRF